MVIFLFKSEHIELPQYYRLSLPRDEMHVVFGPTASTIPYSRCQQDEKVVNLC